MHNLRRLSQCVWLCTVVLACFYPCTWQAKPVREIWRGGGAFCENGGSGRGTLCESISTLGTDVNSATSTLVQWNLSKATTHGPGLCGCNREVVSVWKISYSGYCFAWNLLIIYILQVNKKFCELKGRKQKKHRRQDLRYISQKHVS